MSENTTVPLKANETIGHENKRSVKTVLLDLIYLLKGLVLVANVFPVLAGFWLALAFTGTTLSEQWGLFLYTMIGSTLVIAGALALNNWYEVDLDQAMERTQKRPTVTGSFSLNAVLALGIGFTAVGFMLLLQTTTEAVIYGFIGWFTYVVLYTFWSKRKYTLNTMIGAISGAVTPLIGWTAIAPGFHIVPITVALIVLIWQMPHTFSIAMRRYDDYKRAGVAMLPVLYGFEVTKRQILVYVTCLLPLPFFLWSLGTTFVVIATLLNVAWIAIAIKGLYTKNDVKWANLIFIYSVNYLMILFSLMIIVTW
ncbi:heme o synthase [Bacillus thermotolerans]|uniref:heme o synthase n=1 Tax=Bacillus thermotolerans TaxID=1221996 RepID=UPI000591DD73|nr:heme o synthase [Bacillus thermotolerans]KKB34568.1 Heme O synthase, protoheme IX farnesyltransferase COX10-CtaB [Bacillus thermotolerans]